MIRVPYRGHWLQLPSLLDRKVSAAVAFQDTAFVLMRQTPEGPVHFETMDERESAWRILHGDLI